MSEPKIQSHHKKGKFAFPALVIQGFRFLALSTKRKGEGFIGTPKERKSPVRENENFEGPEP